MGRLPKGEGRGEPCPTPASLRTRSAIAGARVGPVREPGFHAVHQKRDPGFRRDDARGQRTVSGFAARARARATPRPGSRCGHRRCRVARSPPRSRCPSAARAPAPASPEARSSVETRALLQAQTSLDKTGIGHDSHLRVLRARKYHPEPPSGPSSSLDPLRQHLRTDDAVPRPGWLARPGCLRPPDRQRAGRPRVWPGGGLGCDAERVAFLLERHQELTSLLSAPPRRAGHRHGKLAAVPGCTVRCSHPTRSRRAHGRRSAPGDWLHRAPVAVPT